MRKMIFLAFLLATQSVLSLAQAAAPSEKSGSENLSKPVFQCNPNRPSTMQNCYFSCMDRRRPAEGACMVPPKATFFPVAEYSDKARKKRVQGTVLLEITVGTDGQVTDAKILRPLEPSLDKQSIENVRRWRFTPATVEGKPIAVVLDVETTFRLR